MSNKENYKKAFSVLQTSDDFHLEVEKMAMKKRNRMVRNVAAAAAVCLVIVGGTSTAYAANVGGIQRTLQLWMHGDQTNVTVNFDGEGSYSMEYLDANGNKQEMAGGGVAIASDGSEYALTEEELSAYLVNGIDVEMDDKGNVLVCYHNQVVDITDQFEDGICYVHLQDSEEELYLTVLKDDEGIAGYSTNPNRYMQYKETEPGVYVAY